MLKVTCAIIVREDGKVLVTQRSATMKLPLKMEFPGGKMETGESAETCLIREIWEELQLHIEIVASITAVDHLYPDFSIHLIPFVCRITGGELVLKEHINYAWLAPQELKGLDWAAADVPVVDHYLTTIDMA